MTSKKALLLGMEKLDKRLEGQIQVEASRSERERERSRVGGVGLE